LALTEFTLVTCPASDPPYRQHTNRS